MKTFRLSLLILCLLPLLSSCDKEEEEGTILWDFSPQHFEFLIVDQNGNNRLDPANENAWKPEDITATYKDENYPCAIVDDPIFQPHSEIITRQLPAFMRGLRTSTEEQNRVLFFGDFSPETNYKKTPLILNWPDGTQTMLTFDCYIIWHSKENPEVVIKLYHEDQEMEMKDTRFGKQVTIRK